MAIIELPRSCRRFINCTVGTDTILTTSKSYNEPMSIYSISGLNMKFLSLLDEERLESVSGDRWNSFHPDGPIFWSSRKFTRNGNRVYLHLGSSNAELVINSCTIKGRFLLHDNSISHFDAGQGKLIQDSEFRVNSGREMRLLLLEDNTAMIMKEDDKALVADIRCPELITTDLIAENATISGCRLFYYKQRYCNDNEDIKFEKVGPNWYIRSPRYHHIHGIYSWHQASNLLVIITYEYGGMNTTIHLVNSQSLACTRISFRYADVDWYFPSYIVGVPVFCSLNYNEIDVIM